MERKTEKILGYDVDLMTFEDAISYTSDNLCNNKGMHIITINPEIIEQARKSFEYNKIVKTADLVIPDGVGIKIALKLKGIEQEQIPGIDFAKWILKNCQILGKNVALIGSTEEVIKRTEDLLSAEYRELKIVYTHNGFFPKHKEDEIVKNLTGIEPDVVLVALGAPKQDYFIRKCIEKHPNAIYIGVGGAFDVWAGNVKRAPEFFRVVGLEWLYRTIKQPQRFKRIYKTLPIFLIKVII